MLVDIQRVVGAGAGNTYTSWNVDLMGLIGATGATGLTGATGVQGATGSSSVPGGSNTNIQFNDSGNFNGSNSFLFDNTSNIVTINGQLQLNNNTIRLGNNSTSNANANIDYNVLLGANTFSGNLLSPASNSIAIGTGARIFEPNAIAIGAFANAYYPNSITINATGANLVAAGDGRFVVKPVSNAVSTGEPRDNFLFYNTTTGVISYGDSNLSTLSQIANGSSNVRVFNVGSTVTISTGTGGVNSVSVSNTQINLNRNCNIVGNLTVANGNISTQNANVSNLFASVNIQASNGTISGNNLQASNTVSSYFSKIDANILFSNLPTANLVNQNVRTIITDANTTTFYSIVSGGGSNRVPVFCDGTNWRIG
jgi:hypothetical protein